MSNKILQRVLLGAVVVLMVSVSISQSGEIAGEARDRYLRDARELAKKGDFQSAIKKLEPLYSSSPRDEVVVRVFFDLLVEAREYDRAKQVMKQYLSHRASDVRGLAGLACLHFKTGERGEALKLIDKIVSISPEEPWSYEAAFQVLLESDVEDEALVIVHEARRVLNDSTLFAPDVAGVYADAGNHAAAVREYLLAVVGGSLGKEDAAEHIIELASDEDARPTIVETVGKVRTIAAFEITARRVLWEVYLMDGNCEASFAELSALVEKEKPSARFLPLFATESRRKGCHLECSKAYQAAALLAENMVDVAMFLLEKGRCEAEGGLVEDALMTYNRVAEQYANSKWANQALLRMSSIYSGLGRHEEAISRVDRIISASNAGSERHGAIILKGNCLVMMGRLVEAFETYDLVETDWKAEYAQEAFFNLGEIRFYQSTFDEAESYYSVTLRQYPDEPRANDAIDRIMLLRASRAGETYVPQLKDFSRASLLRRGGRLRDAFSVFQRLAEASQVGILQVESLKNLAEIYLDWGGFEQAIRTYKLIGESLDTHISPSALEAVGDIYMNLGKTDDAVQVYEEVILKFPDSVAAGEARRKIEITKRQTVEES